MASGDLKAELECSVCLNVYTDPVMLACGHNFCKVCINCVLDTQRGSRGYSCPECRKTFNERPALQRNIKLHNIVEHFMSTQPDEESGIFCSIHKKILEYYCTEDCSFVCVSCCLIGEHKGHKMVSLEEASEKKKSKMRNVLQKLLARKEKAEEMVQSLQKYRKETEENAASDADRVKALFIDLGEQQKVLEKRVLSEISKQTKVASLFLLDLIQELEIKKKELSGKMHHIEELCKIMNPLTVLKESDSPDVCDTEDKDTEDKSGHDKLLSNGGHVDMAGISQTLQTGLFDIMSGVNVQKYIGINVYPLFITEDKGHTVASLPEQVTQAAPTMHGTSHHPGQPSIQSILRMERSNIMLDGNTAGNDLCISNSRKTVSCSVFTNKYPERPERFHPAQVLSTQSFSSGQLYWEVDVERSQVWSVGMCYPSINRKGCDSEIGWNNKSWGLHKSWLNDQYSVLHHKKWIRLQGKVSGHRVRIYLDYEAGQISFYYLCDLTLHHLYTFNATFTEPLHAILWVGEGCIKING